jgi:hypothetical protein
MKSTIFLAALCLMAPQRSTAQTIHQNDLGLFLIRFPIDTFQNPPRLYLARSLEWLVDSVDERGGGVAFKVVQSTKTSQWFHIDTARQHAAPRIHHVNDASPLARLRFYVMSDPAGWAVGRDGILSVWETVAPDSLRFICSCTGPFGNGWSLAWVECVTPFPDGSILLCVERRGGDAGEFWGGTSFLRGILPCDFQQFHSSSWRAEDSREHRYKEVKHDLSRLVNPMYRVPESCNYYGRDSHYCAIEGPGWKLDSSEVSVIDFWELAKAKFGIDTTQIKLDYVPGCPPEWYTD